MSKKHFIFIAILTHSTLISLTWADTLQVPDGLLLDRPCDTTHARVRVLPSVEYATRVCVDPLRIEDWELMQVHADILEGGGLLSLVSLVYTGQKLRFRIPTLSNNRQKNDMISLVVRDISTAVDLGSSLWPTVGDASEDDHDDIKPTYGLLRSDTEVIITPLTRTKKDMFDAYAWSQPLQVIPTIQDVGQEVLTTLESVTPLLHSIQDVPVGCIFIHPNSYQASAALNRPEWVEVRIEGTKNTVHNGVMARVFFSAEVRESCAGRCTPFRDTIRNLNASVMKINIGLTRDDSIFFQLILLRKIRLDGVVVTYKWFPGHSPPPTPRCRSGA